MAASKKTKWLVRMGVLLAVLIVMSITPIGYLKVGVIEITFLMIPVLVGAITLDTKAGTILGFAFGLTSFIQALTGASPFGAALMEINPVGTIVVCFVPRILMGFLTGVIYNSVKKIDHSKSNTVSTLIAALTSPIMNTVFFMAALILFFGRTDYILAMQGELSLFSFVVAFVGINGVIEAIAAFILGGAISLALTKYMNRCRKGNIMLLVFDIGNTNIKMGVFEGDKLTVSCRITTGNKKTTDEYGIAIASMLTAKGIEISKITRTIVSSVVPNINYSICKAIRQYIGVEPLLLAPGTKTGVAIKTDNPRETGADIIADVAAANYFYGGPCIVVDFGTATKYEVINEKGEFIACVISAGVGLTADVLTSNAAQLPAITIKKPASILTSNTVECMQAGIVFGYIGQVEYIVSKIKEEMGLPEMKVIATGGFGSVIASETKCIDTYDKNLTLMGLKVIADRNKNK